MVAYTGRIKKPKWGNDPYVVFLQKDGVTKEFRVFEAPMFAKRWLKKRLKELNSD